MNRRSFLFGAGALAAPAIVRPGILMPVSVWVLPTVWGDGIHDDAPGLNAFLRGEEVNDLTKTLRRLPDGAMYLGEGRLFRLGGSPILGLPPLPLTPRNKPAHKSIVEHLRAERWRSGYMPASRRGLINTLQRTRHPP